MGKSDRHILDSILSGGISGKKLLDTLSEAPPKIPPRMKKKGPDLPEKPLYMRPKKQDDPIASSQASKENILIATPRIQQTNYRMTSNDRFPTTQKSVSNEREILVAACRAGRERPVEKRQREPAKLLTPTSNADYSKDHSKSSSGKKTTDHHKSLALAPRQQPMVLIPRGFLVDNRGSVINHVWGSPVSYSLWMQQREPRGPYKPPGHQETKLTPILTSSTSMTKTRSNSVTRSGSLTSQGSSSSDSGNETFPKSVLKKHKRSSGGSLNPKSCHKAEHKKNVTFNAFATVQLMEE